MSGLFFRVRRSLSQHALSTVITVAATALASGLVMAVFSINAQTRAAFTGGESGFDAVLGARGSQLQLVLNTVFHLETSPGNIPWALYQKIKKDPRVDLAIPYAVGDNYYGYRIVGTTMDLFDRFEYQKGRKLTVQPGGRVFKEKNREAVIGAFVAEKTGLKVGDEFQPFHGLYYTEGDQPHPERYVVTGVLDWTNSPTDRVMWIPIEGIFRMEGHVLRGKEGETFEAKPLEAIPDEVKEVSAVMLKFRGGPMVGIQLDADINKRGKVATLAWPIGKVMAELFDKLGWVTKVLAIVAYLVVAVATGSILASVYNTMNERRREFAILRALGARRAAVFGTIVAESATIAVLGTAIGYLVCFAILLGASYVIRSETGVVIDLFAPHDVYRVTPLLMLVLGALAGVLPAYNAYKTDVAENLVPHS